MPFPLSNILTPTLDALKVKLSDSVKLTGSIGTNQVYVERYGTLAPEMEETILDINAPFILDFINWSCNNELKSQLRIQPYIAGVATSIGLVKSNGSGKHGFYPYQTKVEGFAYFDVVEYDTVRERFKFKRDIETKFAEGVKITVRNIGTNPINIAVTLIGRKVR